MLGPQAASSGSTLIRKGALGDMLCGERVGEGPNGPFEIDWSVCLVGVLGGGVGRRILDAVEVGKVIAICLSMRVFVKVWMWWKVSPCTGTRWMNGIWGCNVV